MRRDLRIALLAAGVVLGFGSGFHSLRMRAWQHRMAWERHLAGICAEAARTGTPSAATPSWPAPPGEVPRDW